VRLTSSDAERRYAALVAAAGSAVVGLDFDGTLAPIVADPAEAHIHPDAPAVLLELSQRVRAIAVVTGRPARQVLALGGLEEVGRAIGEGGRELLVFGQYGFERWTSSERRVVSPKTPPGLSGFLRDLPRTMRDADAPGAFVEDKGLAIAVHTRRLDDPQAAFARLEPSLRELPQVLRDAGAPDAFVEDKGLAIAVHTRRLDDPVGAFERLAPRLRDLAERHAMTVEPGRNVIEARSPGMDKGTVVRDLAKDLDAGGFLFAGDDLGDLEAFAAVEDLRDQGLPTLLVCSASDEESALLDRSDVVVKGPDGVLDLLRRLSSDARTAG
jgi:trehalose 6-phosphate phosphatase